MSFSLVSKEAMPKPSKSAPFAQVEWLYEMRIAITDSLASAQNFIASKRYMIRFLKDMLFEVRPKIIDINRYFDEYILIRFKGYVEDLRISSTYTVTILSCARIVINYAVANKWIDIDYVLDITLPERYRETDALSPYTEGEMKFIMDGISNELNFSRKLLLPYRRKGVGAPPVKRSAAGRLAKGWLGDRDNMIWYFENVLDCQPVVNTGAHAIEHRSFFRAATNLHGGLHDLYRSWGISAWIGPEIILPYLFLLVSETGLNATVAMNLRVDDFIESHPLTGKPYIRYFKRRGAGGGEVDVGALENGACPLNNNQANKIARIWSEVLRLTEPFRNQISEEKRDFLFIYQTRHAASVGQVRVINDDPKTVGGWAKKFVEKYKIVNKAGKPLAMTLQRFRPSLVSRLLKLDVDIYLIKSILGHGSILTTLKYIDSHDFSPKARREVHRALSGIRKNARDFKKKKFGIANRKSNNNDGMVFATPLALCKNVFNPPDNIRKAANIPLGKPCTIFNMCLRCPRVIILAEHLPRLFLLRRQYLAGLEGALSSAPHRIVIRQSLDILNNLLEPELSDWRESVLSVAEKDSYFLNDLLDVTGYRGVINA